VKLIGSLNLVGSNFACRGRRGFRSLVFLLALALSACGGGSAAPAVGAASNNGSGNGSSGAAKNPAATLSVQVNMHIPGASTSNSQKRHAQFVASSTQGVLVTVYASSDTGHTNPLASSATNVAPGSTACGGTVGARTCAIVIPAPAGSDAFVFDTYDQPPVAGTTTFPAGADLLATGVVPSQTITVGQANTVNVTLGGTLASYAVNPYNTQLLAGLSGQTAAISITAYDAGGNAIIGAYTDSNGNPDPIALDVQETGGSGFTTVAVDGGTPGGTASVTQSSDTIAIHYNGGGSPGYFATINTVPESGPTQQPTFDPLFLTANPSSALTIAAQPTLTIASGQTVTLSYSAENFSTALPGIGGGGCYGVVTFGTPTPTSGDVGSVTIADAAGGNCSAYLALGYTSNITLNITAAGSASANVGVPGTTLAYLALGSGGVGIADAAGATLGNINTTANSVGLDDAGNVYALQNGPTFGSSPGILRKFTPSGSTYPPAYTQSNATYTLTDPDHAFIAEVAGNGEVAVFENDLATSVHIDVWAPGQSGAPTFTITRGLTTFLAGGVDHSGNVYVDYDAPCADNAALTCVFYDVVNGTGTVTRTIAETLVPEAEQGSFSPNYQAVGPDGTLYVAENTQVLGDPLAGLYIYPPTGPERIAPSAASPPLGVDLDAAGNIYVAVNGSAFNGTSWTTDEQHYIAVLSPDAGTDLRNVPVPTSPVTVTAAADGTVFGSSWIFGGSTGSTYAIPAGQFSTQQINSSASPQIALWDGTTTTLSRVRAPQSLGSGSAHAGGFFRFPRQFRK